MIGFLVIAMVLTMETGAWAQRSGSRSPTPPRPTSPSQQQPRPVVSITDEHGNTTHHPIPHQRSSGFYHPGGNTVEVETLINKVSTIINNTNFTTSSGRPSRIDRIENIRNITRRLIEYHAGNIQDHYNGWHDNKYTKKRELERSVISDLKNHAKVVIPEPSGIEQQRYHGKNVQGENHFIPSKFSKLLSPFPNTITSSSTATADTIIHSQSQLQSHSPATAAAESGVSSNTVPTTHDINVTFHYNYDPHGIHVPNKDYVHQGVAKSEIISIDTHPHHRYEGNDTYSVTKQVLAEVHETKRNLQVHFTMHPSGHNTAHTVWGEHPPKVPLSGQVFPYSYPSSPHPASAGPFRR